MPLVNSSGQTIGSVRAWQTTGGVTFRIDASGLPHGVHGIHVHAVGRCDPPEFTTAGAHWNPASRKHGMNNPDGPHAGDLPNVTVAANGVAGDLHGLLDGENRVRVEARVRRPGGIEREESREVQVRFRPPPAFDRG